MDLSTIDTSSVLVSVITLLLIQQVYRHYKAFTFWSSRGIPGPTPWPFVGTSIYYFFKTKVVVDTEWHAKYGNVLGLYAGLDPMLRVGDPELVGLIWVKKFSQFSDRDTKFIHSENQRNWLFFATGASWSHLRSLLTPSFVSSRMRLMTPTLLGCFQKFDQEIKRKIGEETKQAEKNNQKSITGAETTPGADNPRRATFSRDDLMSLTLDFISSSLFAVKLNTYADRTSEFAKRAFAFASFDFLRFVVWLSIPRAISRYFEIDLLARSKYEYFDSLSQKIIDERRSGKVKSSKDFINGLLEARLPNLEDIGKQQIFSDEDDRESHYNAQLGKQQLEQSYMDQVRRVIDSDGKRKLTDAEIRGLATFNFLAGFETTATTLSFCFHVLSHYQDVQAEVFKEIEALALERMQSRIAEAPASESNDQQSNSVSSIEDYADMMSLRKLDAFVSEVLRIFSTVTEHIRVVTADEGVELPVDGREVHLPKGTVISVNGFVMQRDKEVWGPDALEFDMTRFYPENRDRIKRFSYMPFGIGPRNCAGMRFALLTVKLTLANTLLRYKVLASETSMHPPKFADHAFFLQFKNSDFILEPREVELKSF